MPKKKPDLLLEPPPGHPPQEEGRCHLWIPQRGRYCVFRTKPGKLYCGEHGLNEPDNQVNKERIPCPYDSRHTVYVSELKLHLKRCNSKPKPRPPQYAENINIDHDYYSKGVPQEIVKKSRDAIRSEMKSADSETINNFFDRVRQLYQSHVGDIPPSKRQHKSMSQRLSELTNRKHALQQSSILGNMSHLNFLHDHCNFVEFGCGKAELSYYLWLAMGGMKSAQSMNTIVIDRQNSRLKYDRHPKQAFKDAGIEPNWERWMMDIKDVQLSESDVISRECSSCNSKHPVVAYSKHLCGCATDLTLRCLSNYQNDVGNGAIEGALIALCCHQICRWDLYVNRPFLTEECGIDENFFDWMCLVSTWALCGTGRAPCSKDSGEEKQENGNDAEKKDHKNIVNEEDNDATHWTNLPLDERALLGRMCKRILDIGRVKYLQSLGFEAGLIHYVEQEMTEENCALWARWPQKGG